MKTATAVALAASLLAISAAGDATAADEPACRQVRFADPGWTDITATTATAGLVLQSLGYEPEVQILSVAVTFRSLQNGDIDVFLGNWMPTQSEMVEPYLESGIEVVATNLEGAKVTLAVNREAADEGVKAFADLDRFADRFGRKIYSIEPGSSANKNLAAIIEADEYGLGDWEVTEASEQAMLAQVDRATRRGEWVVFLGWEPHPMNLKYEIAYLAGAEEYFGPDYGGATVRTLARTEFLDRCPNLRTFFSQLVFSLDLENRMMQAITDEGQAPEAAARAWLSANPDTLDRWLAGVTTIDGAPAIEAARAALGS
jgi:glycine betaine/proline transport system substrate-binding protein